MSRPASRLAALAHRDTLAFNLHMTGQCNMHCPGCFAPFGADRRDGQALPNLPTESWRRIISTLATRPEGLVRRKINFVGGEPLLVSDLPALLAHAKREGFTTSITTNASLLSRRLDEIAEHTDWIGISIDSFDPQASIRLGRHTRWRPVDYLGAIARVRDRGIRLKINTVVSCVNCDEDMRRPIAAIAPERWKVLRFLLVEGANDRQAELRPSDIEFRSFAHRHR